MRLHHDFVIDQPIATVWRVLTDLRNVATALPGASIEDVESDGTHIGTLKLKLGSFVAQFRGAARYTEVDPATHRVVLTGEGASPQGRAGVRLEGTAEAVSPTTTRVILDSQVDLNGRIAQFGGAMAGDVARQVLDRFVANLSALFDERLPDDSTEPQHAEPAPHPQITGRPSDVEPLDLGSVLVPRALREPAVIATIVVALLLGWLIGHGRSPTVRFDASTWRSLTDAR